MTVTANNTRLSSDVGVNTELTSIGGGAGAESTDNPAAFAYQGVGIIYRKVTATAVGGGGFTWTDGVTTDMTAAATRTFMCKIAVTDFGGLHGTNGLRVRVGETGSYRDYVLTGSAAKIASLVNYPARGGFIIIPIDVNIAAYFDTDSTPTLTAIDEFSAVARFATASAKAENLGLDIIDVGTGLTLTGAAVALVDLVDTDEGTVNNRWGYAFLLADGVFGAFGTWSIADSGVTTITDSARETIVFLDGLFAAGWSGLSFDLTNASTIITLGNKTVNSLGSTAVEDSRAVFNATGTAGSLTLNDWVFNNFESMVLTSAITLNRPSLIAVENITLAGAIILDAIVSDSPVASNVASITTTNDIDNITGAVITAGATGHFADIQTAGTYDWDGNTLSGYGGTPGTNLVSSSGDPDAALLNSSGGLVTLNVVNGASVPSIRNTAGSTTVVVAAVSYELTGLDAGADVTIVDITVPATPVELFNEVAGIDGIVTYSFDGALSGTAIGVYIRNTVIEINEFDDVLPSENISFKPSQDNDDVYI